MTGGKARWHFAVTQTSVAFLNQVKLPFSDVMADVIDQMHAQVAGSSECLRRPPVQS
jgi:hypothetical protein